MYRQGGGSPGPHSQVNYPSGKYIVKDGPYISTFYLPYYGIMTSFNVQLFTKFSAVYICPKDY